MLCVLVIQRACLTQKHRLHDLNWQLLLYAGPNGVCVREVSRQSGADIKSWTDKHKASLDNKHRPCRNFLVQVGMHQSSRLLLTPQLLLLQYCLTMTMTIAAQHAKQAVRLLLLSTTVGSLLLHWR